MRAPEPNPPLRAGGTVALTAPASPVSHAQAQAGAEALRSLGFTVIEGQSLRRSVKGYAAGTPRDRGQELNRFFADPTVDGIWCAPGGYTAAQVLPFLDYDLIACNPKPFIGYSDITALHTGLQQRSGLASWHGPMACVDLAGMPDSGTLDGVGQMLMTGGIQEFRNPDNSSTVLLRPGRAEGVVIGGNLTVLTTLIGTPFQPDTAGKLLFLEEIEEPVPRVERMLRQMEGAGLFRRALGVLLGSFARCENPYCPDYDVLALFRDFFCGFPGPVTANLQCGHCAPTGTIPLGWPAWVDDGRVWFFLS